MPSNRSPLDEEGDDSLESFGDEGSWGGEVFWQSETGERLVELESEKDFQGIIALMHEHSGNVLLQAHAIGALANGMGSADEYFMRGKIVSSGGVEAVARAMRDHGSGHEPLFIEACAFAATLGRPLTDEMKKKVLKEKIVQMVLSMARACTGRVFECFLRPLRDLSHDGDIAHEIAEAGGVEMVLGVMRKDKKTRKRQLQQQQSHVVLCCEILSKLAEGSEQRKRLIGNKGIEHCLSVARNFGGLVRAEVAHALGVLLSGNVERAQHVVAHGGIHTLLEGLRSDDYPEPGIAWAHILFALGAIAQLKDEWTRKIVDAGGIRETLRALDKGRESKYVGAKGAHMVAMLVQKESMFVDEGLSREVVGAGGFAVLLEAAKRFEELQSYQGQVLYALGCLAPQVDEDDQASGCAQLALERLEQFGKSAEVHQQCLWVLAHLTGNVACAVRVAADGGVDRVLDSMETFPKNAKLQRAGNLTLLHLSRVNKEVARSIACKRGIEIVYRNMRANVNDKQTVDTALVLLYAINVRNLDMAEFQGQWDQLLKRISDQQERTSGRTLDRCAMCGKTAIQAGRQFLLKCSGCSLGRAYCGAECQNKHWKSHKKECKANNVMAHSNHGAGEAVQVPTSRGSSFRDVFACILPTTQLSG